MKYSVITLFIYLRAKEKISVKQMYQAVKNAGYDTIDVDSMPLLHGVSREEIREALAAAGLKVGCYISFLPLPKYTDADQQAGLEYLKEELLFCKKLGTRNFMFVPSDYQEDMKKYGEKWVTDRLKEALKKAVETANELGLQVGIEDAPDITFPMCRQKELEGLLSAVPGVKLIYDTGNMIPAEESSLEFYEALKDHVMHIHVKDMEYQKEAVGDVCIDGRYIDGTRHGKGIVPLTSIMECLKRDQYQEFLSLEYVPSEEAIQSGEFEKELSEILQVMKEME